MTKSVTVKDLKERLNLELICSETGLERPIQQVTYLGQGWNLQGFSLIIQKIVCNFLA